MNQFGQYKKQEHEGIQVADVNRIKNLFFDIESLYGRGKLKGEPLEQYLELLNIYNTVGSLDQLQAIKLNMLLAEYYNPAF